MLIDIQERGVKEVLLFVSDGLKGLKDACLETFPRAQHQACWIHIQRNIGRLVRREDKARVMGDAKQIYQAGSLAEALEAYEIFKRDHRKRYPKVVHLLENNMESLFSFFTFPKAIRPSIYTTNLIENLNKQLKRDMKRKEQFPNEEALDRFTCVKVLDYNQRFYERIHKGFNLVTAELIILFESEVE